MSASAAAGLGYFGAEIRRYEAARTPARASAFPNNYEFQQTEQGWKWVLPEVAVTRWLHVLNDSVLTKPAAK